MSYKIKEYSYKQAERLGVKIRPSTRKNKKIDVFKNNVKVASIGDIRYRDYPTYIETKGKKYADDRKNLYRKRHVNDINVKNSNGFFSARLLW
jgi:hypothetical protein